MAASDDVFQFVSGLPDWQQDLYLLAVATPKLSDAEQRRAIDLLLGERTDARRVTRADVIEVEPEGPPLKLRAIANPASVNCLAAGAQLEFEDNLNTVFGENGAGKTGYSRIVKHGARTLKRETVLPDVLSDAPATSPPRATLRLARGETEQDLEIVLDRPAPAVLAAISCFDEGCGERYLTSSNELELIPRPLRGLERLGAAQKELDRMLERRIEERRPGPLDVDRFGRETQVRLAIDQAKGITGDNERLRDLATLDAAERARLNELARAVAEIDADRAGDLRDRAQRDAAAVRVLLRDLVSAAELLSKASLAEFRAHDARAKAARKTLEEHSAARLAELGLPGVDGQAWRVMWHALSNYAAAIGAKWPPEPGEGRCLACLQSIEDEAADRLRDFDAFFRSDVERQLAEAEGWLERSTEALPEVNELTARHQAAMDALDASGSVAGAAVHEWFQEAGGVVQKVASGVLDPSVVSPRALPRQQLDEFIDAREKEARELLAREEPKAQQRLRSELDELKSRAALAGSLTDVSEYARRSREVARMQAARRLLGTAAISRLQRRLSASLVTDELQRELRRQLEALQFPHIEVVECRPTTERGKPLATLGLRAKGGASLAQVLCDGEQRRLALAMFLAEASLDPNRHPLLFDDPVSSVDHRGRRHIAKTLVELARSRQVIVFTHDLVFIADLQRGAQFAEVPQRTQAVYRQGRVTGHVTSDLPWEGLSTKRRIGALKAEIHKLSARSRREDDPIGYARDAANFSRRLRQAFERAVEDEVLGGVVTRRDPAIHIKRLRDVVMTDPVLKLARRGLDENSPWLHDPPRADNAPPPTPDELADGLAVLEKLHEQTKKGREEQGRRRNAPAEGQAELVDVRNAA